MGVIKDVDTCFQFTEPTDHLATKIPKQIQHVETSVLLEMQHAPGMPTLLEKQRKYPS